MSATANYDPRHESSERGSSSPGRACQVMDNLADIVFMTADESLPSFGCGRLRGGTV